MNTQASGMKPIQMRFATIVNAPVLKVGSFSFRAIKNGAGYAATKQPGFLLIEDTVNEEFVVYATDCIRRRHREALGGKVGAELTRRYPEEADKKQSLRFWQSPDPGTTQRQRHLTKSTIAFFLGQKLLKERPTPTDMHMYDVYTMTHRESGFYMIARSADGMPKFSGIVDRIHTTGRMKGIIGNLPLHRFAVEYPNVKLDDFEMSRLGTFAGIKAAKEAALKAAKKLGTDKLLTAHVVGTGEWKRWLNVAHHYNLSTMRPL